MSTHARWGIERTFQETKQKLGLEQTQLQLPKSVRRQPPMLLILYSLVVLWFLQHGYQWMNKHTAYRDPWNTNPARPSFSDMLATLRRAAWAEGILDPPCKRPNLQEKIVAYLVRVVAGA